MLKQAALEFGRSCAELALLEFTCAQTRRSLPDVLVDVSGQLEQNTYQALGNLKRVCILADMQEVLPEIDRFGATLNGKARIEDIGAAARHLKFRIYDALQSEYYLQVDRAEVNFYGNKVLFGAAVAGKFKGAAGDIENAGNCIALQQPTACVFHLMRAMEVAVRHLGKRLKITITPKSTWRQMTGQMTDKIKKMPEATAKQKAKKDDWEAARANLHHVGSVWRNQTMHPASSYTRPQARDVLDACRVFMNALSAL